MKKPSQKAVDAAIYLANGGSLVSPEQAEALTVAADLWGPGYLKEKALLVLADEVVRLRKELEEARRGNVASS